jgi:hypothetical protein
VANEHIRRALSEILGSRGLGVPDFVWNILEIKNVNSSTIDVYYEFLRDHLTVLEGDVVEFGVYRGASLLSTALLLKAYGSSARVYGFDSFSGFPPPNPNDDKRKFAELFERGEIDEGHYRRVQFKVECEGLWPREHVFDNTSLDFVRRKIELFELDNVELVTGDITQNLHKLPGRILATLYDCDLYAPYAETLPAVWERTAAGGLLYFDEYYSLKYPGPRIAVDDFCRTRGLHPIKSWRHSQGSFERWSLRK